MIKQIEMAAKNKTGTILRKTKKKFEDKELPQELFIKTSQKTKF